MSVELLYTSAAQGLKQGSRGFCTVLSTAGMPINLATRLEGLSAYRHQFPPNHPDANQNPVCFSHLRFSIGGRQVSILSRISDYGIDYSQRTNKLAHHVVLDAHELTPAGPAWLMEHGKIFRDDWSGQCETPATGPAIAMQNQSPRVCLEWGHRCGDAGWGGVVADAFVQSGSKPLWIVYGLSQSQQLLRLLNESIALLPVDQRWRATFSTYATNLPPDADCKVRCVLQGTDEARLAPARGAVIDLTKPLPAPPATANVIAAREGPDSSTLNAASSPPAKVTNKELPTASPSLPHVEPYPVAVDDGLNQVDDALQLASLPNLPPTIKAKQFMPKSAASVEDTSSNTRRLKWILVAASVAAVLMLITTIALLVRNTKDSPGRASAPSALAGSSSDTGNDGAGRDLTYKDAADKQAADKQAADKQAADKQAADKQAADKQAADKQAADKQAADKLAADKLAADKLAADKLAADKLAADKLAADKLAAVKQAVEEVEQLKGEIMAKQLFEGTLSVKLQFSLDEDLEGRKYRPSEALGPRLFKADSSLDIDDQQSHRLKSVILRSTDPPSFVVELTPEIADLRNAAKAVSDAYEAAKKPVVKWNESVRKFQDAELFVPILPEPNAKDTLLICLKAIGSRLDRVRDIEDKIERQKANQDVSRVNYDSYLESLAAIESSYVLLVSRIESVKSNGKIDSGPIFYFDESDGTTTKTRPVSRTYSIDAIKPLVYEAKRTEQVNSFEKGGAQKATETSPKN